MIQVREPVVRTLSEHIVEFVSDAGEGAQKAGVSFAKLCARSGHGLWTVEIIPSEIQPPPHSTGSASGNRVRLATRKQVTNAGDLTNVVLAFNEMALLSRIEADAVASDALVLIDNQWATHTNIAFQHSYADVLRRVREMGCQVVEIPLEAETLKHVDDATKGKNMFAVGILTALYGKDVDIMREVIADTFANKSGKVIETAQNLAENGYAWGMENLQVRYQIDAVQDDRDLVAMNGNTALAIGAVAAGFELCSMYPITPATSASHALSGMFESLGGIVHQAEDEIAAIGVALGASFAGNTALTITSGPGMALKTEFQGLAVMVETPLVIIDVQRGGPSTGLPTKIEQGDLLHCLYGTPGDAPKIVMAVGDIEECYYVLSEAKRIAEEYRALVVILSDANLATGQQLFERPDVSRLKPPMPPPLPAVEPGTLAYDWDEETGLSQRLIPGQPGGMGVVTSLNHDRNGRACYDSVRNQRAHRMRSRKLRTFQKTLPLPKIHGPEEGDLLLVSWGSTRGAVDEAVDRLREEGASVASVNLRYLNPLPNGLKELFSNYRKVMTVELNYSDDPDDPGITAENRRYAQLAWLLRASTLMDIDCFAYVPGRPLMPSEIVTAAQARLEEGVLV